MAHVRALVWLADAAVAGELGHGGYACEGFFVIGGVDDGIDDGFVEVGFFVELHAAEPCDKMNAFFRLGFV